MCRIRDFPTFEYMRFAKAHHGLGLYNFLNSGMPHLGGEAFPLRPEELFFDRETPYGHPELMAAVANHYGVPEGEVFLAPGTSGVNFFLAGALFAPGDEVVVERPTYEVLHLLPEVFGANAVRWDRSRDLGFRPDPEILIPLLGPKTSAVFLTNPHNPSGTFLDGTAMEEMVRITTEREIPLVVDEVYLDSIPGAKSVRRFGGLSVSTASLTKVYGLGRLRVGWALAPPDLVDTLRRFHDLATVNCSAPSQAVALKAFARIEALRRRAVEMNEANFPLVDRWISETEGLAWTAPHGPLIAFPRLTRGVSSSDLFELLLRDLDTVITPGRYFDGFEDHFRIGFGMDRETLSEGLSRIAEGIRRLS